VVRGLWSAGPRVYRLVAPWLTEAAVNPGFASGHFGLAGAPIQWTAIRLAEEARGSGVVATELRLDWDKPNGSQAACTCWIPARLRLDLSHEQMLPIRSLNQPTDHGPQTTD
jgi:hypothetical protein